MRRIEVFARPGAARRAGFTLIELLVVIAIIATLMALTAGAVLRFMGTQQESNTRSFLDRTQGQLSKAVSAVKDDAMKSSMAEVIPGSNPQTTVHQYLMTGVCNVKGVPAAAPLVGADTLVEKRARVIYVKLRLRQAFPMDFGEAGNPFPLPPLQAYQAYMQQHNIGGKVAQPWESSACLLMALGRAQSGGGVDAGDIGAGGATRTAAYNGASVPYLADGFGTELRFTRVPVGSSVLNANPYPGPGQNGNNDPMDPEGLLNSGTWRDADGQTRCRALFTTLTQQKLSSPPKGRSTSYRLAPMIASAGQNKQWETDPVTFQTTSGTSDDLYSTP